ncbi:Retrovirus-related Pol polyprotein from transposon TNT 1-94 Protease [Vigna angularis]|uniref:Retrovirus-related Pol polyprotein from transposon TNT 1-94 Protease n=1 Tax=Phaseolus angularis TaxID=3914 RepID=A0A8T0JU01_PHAAN|nr:Retrovirus-related Pol polyprotein from transposon TNT 1-94 Protease [Vigna angularis]
MKFKLFQMDVKSAFLNGYIKEDVFVEQPPGFEDFKNPNHIYKLKNALYGLKQAPRSWYERLSNFLVENGFNRGKIDSTLFIKRIGKHFLIVQVYVDDIIFGSSNATLCENFAKSMQGEFEMSMMGELTFFLGLQIKQMEKETFISQTKYCREILKKFEMDNAKEASTPMGTSCYLDKDETGKEVSQTKYRSMIGSLLYLTASRPDIMQSVCVCARYQSSPRESHLTAVKRIFKYLKGTTSFGLWYPSGAEPSLVGFSDADYEGCKIDRKSTSGTYHFLGSSLVSWHSKKQVCVALSTTEAEYIAAGRCCAQILWMKQQLEDYDIHLDHIPLKCDNTSAIKLTKNPIMHSRTKHIEIRHHFIRDHVQKGDCEMEFIDSKHQLAEIFTKALPKDRFFELRRDLGILEIVK